MISYGAADTVNGNAREIADMLVRPGQLIEQRCLSAVLVADQRENELTGIDRSFGMLFLVIVSRIDLTDPRVLFSVNRILSSYKSAVNLQHFPK